MTTGERIKNARKAAGLTQRELGEKLGLSYQAVAQWENDLRKPKYETIVKISDALGVHPADLDESLVINLGSDVLIEAEDGELIRASMYTREGKMLSSFQALNDLGKDEMIRYADFLLDSDQYRKIPKEKTEED